MTCPTCQGQFPSCHMCGGSGQVPNFRVTQCPRCGGRGRTGNDMCCECMGSGTITQHRRDDAIRNARELNTPPIGNPSNASTWCDVCNGSGAVPTREAHEHARLRRMGSTTGELLGPREEPCAKCEGRGRAAPAQPPVGAEGAPGATTRCTRCEGSGGLYNGVGPSRHREIAAATARARSFGAQVHGVQDGAVRSTCDTCQGRGWVPRVVEPPPTPAPARRGPGVYMIPGVSVDLRIGNQRIESLREISYEQPARRGRVTETRPEPPPPAPPPPKPRRAKAKPPGKLDMEEPKAVDPATPAAPVVGRKLDLDLD